jgi:hypothetical protein
MTDLGLSRIRIDHTRRNIVEIRADADQTARLIVIDELIVFIARIDGRIERHALRLCNIVHDVLCRTIGPIVGLVIHSVVVDTARLSGYSIDAGNVRFEMMMMKQEEARQCVHPSIRYQSCLKKMTLSTGRCFSFHLILCSRKLNGVEERRNKHRTHRVCRSTTSTETVVDIVSEQVHRRRSNSSAYEQ